MPTENYVNLGSVIRKCSGMQCQYGSRYFCKNWSDEYKYLGEGLRIIGTSVLYHSMEIHKDDVEEATKRLKNQLNMI
jgi:hypothetical protein